MVYVIIVFLAVVFFFVVALKLKAGGAGSKAAPDAYYLRKSLFTAAERSFYGVLISLQLQGLTVVSKVRLADVFGVKKGLGSGDRQRAQNRINAKHVDFLLLADSDGRPVLGIELDDKSHEEEARIVRDAFVDTVFASAGLPILHVPAKRAYDPRELRALVEKAIVI